MRALENRPRPREEFEDLWLAFVHLHRGRDDPIRVAEIVAWTQAHGVLWDAPFYIEVLIGIERELSRRVQSEIENQRTRAEAMPDGGLAAGGDRRA